MPKKYELLSDSKICDEAKKGMIVYNCIYHDYGCASDDTRMLGHRHISVTLDPDGGYPFFTHPESGLKEVR